MAEDREAPNNAGWSPEEREAFLPFDPTRPEYVRQEKTGHMPGEVKGEPMSDEDHEYILWMANHIQRELDDAFFDRNVNGDDSYLKELDERYRAGFLDTDLFGENPEWDEGDAGWDTRGMALKIAKDLFKRGKGVEWNARK